MEQSLAGLGKKERNQIALLLKASLPVITSELASKVLKNQPYASNSIIDDMGKKRLVISCKTWCLHPSFAPI